jgi:hypothetical protein
MLQWESNGEIKAAEHIKRVWRVSLVVEDTLSIIQISPRSYTSYAENSVILKRF